VTRGWITWVPVAAVATVLAPLALLALLTACGREETPRPSETHAPDPPGATHPDRRTAPVPAYCREAAVVQLGAEMALDPDPGMGAATQVWQGDLNADGLEDLLLRFGDGCSSYGDCPYTILVACSSASSFGAVWGPAYSFDLAVEESSAGAASPSSPSSPWLTLLDTQRDGSEVSVRRLAFDGERYAITEIVE